MVKLPKDLKEIGNESFWDCENLKEIVLPRSLTKIGKLAFFGSGLQYIVVPKEVTDYTLAFANSEIRHCTVLSERISDSAFSMCSNREAISLGKEVKEIGCDAFMSCSSLSEYTIPEGIVTIGKRAFQGCEKLCRISIPSTVKEIGEQAFSCCESLKEVFVKGYVNKWGKFMFFASKSIEIVFVGTKLYKKLTRKTNSYDLWLTERLWEVQKW